jgi:hypothetical protein
MTRAILSIVHADSEKATTFTRIEQAPNELPYEEWKRRFDAWQIDVAARADRYPPGFAADVSRESIYDGCGE